MPVENDKCVTATLVRGKSYNYNYLPSEFEGMPVDKIADKYVYYAFARSIAKPVPADLADKLEELVETTIDKDGDEIEKPLFRIERNASRRVVVEEGAPKRTAMRLISADEVKRPKPRPAPAGREGGVRALPKRFG